MNEINEILVFCCENNQQKQSSHEIRSLTRTCLVPS